MMIRLAAGSVLVVDLNVSLRAEGVGGVVRSRMLSEVVCTSTNAVEGSVVVVVVLLVVPGPEVVVVLLLLVLVEPACVVVVVLVVVLVVVDVVVVPTVHGPSVGGKLCGSAGSVWQSISRLSNTRSRSRSTPIRKPEPGGTQVNVISWPPVAARLRTCVVVRTGSALRSRWKLLLPT